MMHQIERSSPLSIYNASAGSGKTYTLVYQFLRHTLDQQPPNATPWSSLQPLARTLCITFTKKATGELKERIIHTLYALWQGQSPMLESLSHDLHLTTHQLQSRAEIALRALLANYSLLSVSTIDSFVQRMGTTLLWELDIPHQIGTSLDLQELLTAASELLLARLDKHEETYDWLRNLAKDGVQKGQSWRFQQRIASIGRMLYTPTVEQMPLEKRLDFFSINRIAELRADTQQTLERIATQVRSLFENLEALRRECNIGIDDFAYSDKSHWAILSRIVKSIGSGQSFELSSRTDAATGSPDSWFPKKKQGLSTEKRNAMRSIAASKLLPPYKQLVRYIHQHRPAYLMCIVAQKHLPLLALLSRLRECITEISRNRHTLHISDMATLLRDLMQDDDSSFIFERMGTSYDSLLIDEFQDTSTTQWALLEPLVKESLAKGGLAMLVGDVKQAIYRWRGGDWQLLAKRIPEYFSRHFGCEQNTLAQNYRSAPTIVEFNNHLFRQASAEMGRLWEEIATALPDDPAMIDEVKTLSEHYLSMQDKEYGQLDQIPVSSTIKGYVEIALIPHDPKVDNSPNQKLEDNRINYTIARIDYLIDQMGVLPGDIAILVRRRATATLFVNALLAHGQTRKERPYSVVSQDALQIDLSPDVQIMLAALRIATQRPTQVDYALVKQHVASMEGVSDKLLLTAPLFQTSPRTDHYAQWLEQFNTYPLLEAFDAIALGLCLPSCEPEIPYMQKLRDIAHAYQKDHIASLQAFITSYEQQDPSMRILDLPYDSNAINVLTIHKSKGLEFNTVICTEVDWEINPQQGDLLWGEPNLPSEKGRQLPTTTSKDALGSAMAITALEEIYLRHIDSLNLLYVAFTRAKQRLFIVTQDGKAKSGGTFQNFLQLALTLPMEGKAEHVYANAMLHSWGHLTPSTPSERAQAMPQNAIPITLSQKQEKLFETKPLRIRQAINISPAHSFQQLADRRRLQTMGESLHALLARYHTNETLLEELHQLEAQGIINPQMALPLYQSIQKALGNAPLATCFNPANTHWIERDLLDRSGKLLRPDRITLLPEKTIVLDFKFAQPEPEYAKQVATYIHLIGIIGLPSPHGYLWYINPHTAETHIEAIPPI